jgi:hypothetical protein
VVNIGTVWSYRRILVTKGSGGSGSSLQSHDLDSVGELYPKDDFRQLGVAIEATPTSLGGLGEFEDHGERSLVRECVSACNFGSAYCLT